MELFRGTLKNSHCREFGLFETVEFFTKKKNSTEITV